jgi:hypothetical protein
MDNSDLEILKGSCQSSCKNCPLGGIHAAQASESGKFLHREVRILKGKLYPLLNVYTPSRQPELTPEDVQRLAFTCLHSDEITPVVEKILIDVETLRRHYSEFILA